METGQRLIDVLASVVLLGAGMTFPATVHAQFAGVTFWNKLDGGVAAVESEIGPVLNYYDPGVDGPGVVGSVAFVPGRFGNAATVGPGGFYPTARVRALVLRDLRGVLNPERGTIAVWYREKERPVPYEHNNYLMFGGGFDLVPPVQLMNSNDGSRPQTLQFVIRFGGERTVLDALFTPPLNEWVHLAAVWDRRGIDGTPETVRLYVNGGRVSATTATAWGTGFDNNNVDIAGGNDLIQDKFALDNIVVYDYAKTDFSDRFDENPLGRTTAWVTIKANTTDQVIDALWTASRTRTPTTIKVAPGHYRFVQNIDTGVGNGALPPITSTVHVIGTDTGTTIFDGAEYDVSHRIFTVKKGGYLVVRKLTVTGGVALEGPAAPYYRGGGAAANFGGFLRFDDCLLVGNGAGSENASFGGAILSQDGRLHLERTTVMNNRVDGRGGGVAVIAGSGTVLDSIISGNEAGYEIIGGGGIYVYRATVAINGSTVSGNHASNSYSDQYAFGGGILNMFGTVWLTDSAVTENFAGPVEGVGGGIFNSDGGTLRIKDGTVAGNSASRIGGGIYNSGHLLLEGATVTRNLTDGIQGGGGVWNVLGASFRAARSLLANNAGGSAPSDCTGRMMSDGYNALGDTRGCDLRPSYVLHGRPTNDLVGVDPRLAEMQDNGAAGKAHFPLLEQSPLIDAGGPFTESCMKFDQIGQPRVDGDADRLRECDIGAIEYQLP